MTAAGDVLGGKYQLLRLLGEGGMGQVFEAVNQNTDRRVAIKTLHSQWTGDASVVQRFLREARAATKIRHPNVVDVLDLDVDRDTGAPYIVQEFLAGESLEGYLDARPDKRIPVDEALRILVPVMEALATAHALGIVHRDLKPANLFLALERGGAFTPKVIDFGIAKLMESRADNLRQTATGVLVGTPSYMSPEQAAGASDIDAGTDVWSLGVVLYELLTGSLPYEAPNYNLLVAKIVYEEPAAVLARDPSLPPDVAAVVTRALQKNRGARFASMQSMLDATLACAAAPARVSVPPLRTSAVPATTLAPAATTLAPTPTSAPSLVGWTAPQPAAPGRTAAITALALVAFALVAFAGFLSFRPAPVTVALTTPTSQRPAVPPPAPPPTPIAAPPSDPEPAVVAAPPAVVAAPPPAPVVAPVVAPVAPVVARRASPPTRRAPVRRTAGHDFDRGYPE